MRPPLAALCLLLAACATAPEGPPAPPLDPLAALPQGAAVVGYVTPYQFQEQGAAGLEEAATRLGQSDRAVGRLALARALVDALLYAEVSRDAALLEALEALARRHHQGQPLWAWVRALLEAPSDAPAVREAQAEGLALVDALQHRALDGPYHAALARLIERSPLWGAQARAARLLDLDEALVAAHEAPLEERAGLLREIFAAGLCQEGGCAPRGCPQGAQGPALVAACGWEALGWAPSASVWLADEDGVFVAALMRRAREDLAALGAGREPLSRALTGALGLLEARLARRRPQVAVPGLALPGLAVAPAEGFGQQERALGLRGGWLWVGAAPKGPLSLSEEDTWAWPGRPVAALEGPPRRALELGAVARAWGEAGQGEGPVVVWASGQERAQALARGLGLAREALGGGGAWEVRVGVWDQGRGRPGWRAVKVLAQEDAPVAVPRPGSLPALVREAWLLLGEGGAWWVVGGQQVGEVGRGASGALALEALREQAAELSRLGAVAPVVRVRALDAGPSVEELVWALEALSAAGLEVLLVP